MPETIIAASQLFQNKGTPQTPVKNKSKMSEPVSIKMRKPYDASKDNRRLIEMSLDYST